MKSIDTIHTHTAQHLEHVMQLVALGNWQRAERSVLEQSVELLLQVKASYLSTHPSIAGNAVLPMFDETLIGIYRCLDTIDGHDIYQRSDLYRALAQAQYPLLALINSLPHTVEVEQEPLREEALEDDPIQEDAPALQSSTFRWSASMVAQLQSAYAASTHPTAAARIQDVAEHYGWPVGSVTYKVYALKLQESHSGNGREASSKKEGD